MTNHQFHVGSPIVRSSSNGTSLSEICLLQQSGRSYVGGMQCAFFSISTATHPYRHRTPKHAGKQARKDGRERILFHHLFDVRVTFSKS
jgi:hypothetical protein